MAAGVRGEASRAHVWYREHPEAIHNPYLQLLVRLNGHWWDKLINITLVDVFHDVALGQSRLEL